MTAFRALCAELFFIWSRATNPDDLFENLAPLIARTRAALAAEPQEPTDEELDELWADIDGGGAIWAWQHFARAVLARWGNTAPRPIPVTDRLPGAEDCDSTGCCWALNPRKDWCQICVTGRNWSNPTYTHWLPAHALPLPEVEGC